MKYDIKIKNVNIVDGTGKPAYRGTVLITGTTIAAVGEADGEAETVIDGSGKYLTPGFIDSHGHNDLTILFDPSNKYKLEQGVTTEIAGCCGETLFPVSAENYEECNLSEAILKFGTEENDFNPREFVSGKAWFRYMDRLKLGTNMITLVGHGAIRAAVMGFQARKATEKELEQMKELLREAMEAGAAGMSSGIAYAPGVFAPEEEIRELCRIVAEYDGFYCTHMRNQGAHLLDSVEETLRVTKETGVRTVISHLKSIGKPNWGQIEKVRERIDRARSENLPVTWDSYPYRAGSTTLTVTLPPSLLEGGGQQLAERIRRKEWQEYVKQQIAHPTEVWENAIGSNGFGDIFILSAPNTPAAEGKTIQEYADLQGRDPFDVYFELIADNMETADVKTINFVMCEEDLQNALFCPYSMVGSDGSVVSEKKQTHPRGVGTFPRYLGRYIRDGKVLTLEEGICKITGIPAEFYGLTRKGIIRPGYDADLVLLDYQHVMDHAEFGNCFQPNEGIELVILNGNIVVENNRFNGTCCGKALKYRNGSCI